jgi:hypothetical protein
MPSLAVLAQLLQQLPGLTLEGLKDLVVLGNAVAMAVKVVQVSRRQLRRWRKRRQARRRARAAQQRRAARRRRAR